MRRSALFHRYAMPPLVDVDSLHRHLHDPEWIVVDCRHDLGDVESGRRAYAEGHVPGAYFLHLDEDLSGPQRGPDGRFRGRHPLPDRDQLARRLAALGVARASMLVAYDAADAMVASRLWWLSRWLGHERVAVLDGGFKAWREHGYEVSTSVPAPRGAGAPDSGEALVRTVDAETLLAQLGSQRYRVVDARAAERYRGDVEPLDAKAGHIPGACNRPFRDNLREDGRFKSPDALRAEFAALLGEVPPDRVVHQCGSGVSACHNLLAMAVAGMDGGLLYPGSWSEWSSDPRRPIATGSAR